jgi:signal transduction histidine kinase
LSAIRTDIRSMIDNLRHICSSLRPPTIDSLGLGAAVKSFADDWSRRTGVPVTLTQEANLDHLPEDIALSVFRIIQESLNNVRKHALATAVQIRFKDLSPRMLMIAISDNGRGLSQDFDLSALSAASHYGLLGISERVALLGGRLSFQNQDGGGLLIRVEIPHPRLLPAD